MDQKAIETMPENLNTLWNSTSTGPAMPRKIWALSQMLRLPHFWAKRKRLRSEYSSSSSMKNVPRIPNRCPAEPLWRSRGFIA